MDTTTGHNVSALEPAADASTERQTAPFSRPSSLEPRAYNLPDKPLVVIEPSKSALAINFADIWAYRELLYFLAWRDLKVRYKQTILGVAWVVMQPLLITIIFTIFLGMLARVPSDGTPYPVFVYAGLLPWTFFSGAVVNSGISLAGNAHLITKVYFPRMIIPAAAIGARVVDFLIGFVILAGLMLYYRVPLTAHLVMLPVLSLLVILLALGFGVWISSINVKYRDVGFALPALMQLWMFVSPIMYPLSLVPEKWRSLYSLNPLVGIIDGFRSALFGRAFNWSALAVSATFVVLMLIYATYAFRRVEKSFADVV
jgi:lipopolysaccharide transport system permease protein